MNAITLIKLILDARENTEVVVYGGSGPIWALCLIGNQQLNQDGLGSSFISLSFVSLVFDCAKQYRDVSVAIIRGSVE